MLAPANVYSCHLRVEAYAGAREQILEVRIGDPKYHAMLESEARACLPRAHAMEAVRVSEVREKAYAPALHLATDWSYCATAMRCKIRWSADNRSHRFLFSQMSALTLW